MMKKRERIPVGHLHPVLRKPDSDSFISRKMRTAGPMLCYMLAYLTCFMLIERWNRLHYAVIHTGIDDLIPFCPVFVIPYMLWFPYVAIGALFLLIKNEDAYHRLCSVLAIGMTVFIVVSVVYPNIHLMRPEIMPDEGIFSRAVMLLYMIDTPTNLTPSIHVFNSLAVIASVWSWDWRTEDGHVYAAPVRTCWRVAAAILGLLITLSTMLIKQHSFSDVVIAAALFLVIYIAVYRFDLVLIGSRPRRYRSGRLKQLHPSEG